jgi:hypothetical protein
MAVEWSEYSSEGQAPGDEGHTSRRFSIGLLLVERNVQPERTPESFEIVGAKAVVGTRSAQRPPARRSNDDAAVNLASILSGFIKDATDRNIIGIEVPDSSECHFRLDGGASRRLELVTDLDSSSKTADGGIAPADCLTETVCKCVVGLVAVGDAELRRQSPATEILIAC